MVIFDLFWLCPAIFGKQFYNNCWWESILTVTLRRDKTNHQLFNWFQLFSSENCFPKIAGHSQNRSKMTILKGGVDVFSYFSFVSVILFSNQSACFHWPSSCGHVPKYTGVWFIQVKSTKVSYIGLYSFKVPFIQDSGLFRFQVYLGFCLYKAVSAR
jgi:hypothetical protein